MKTKKLVTGICVLCVLILAAVVIFFVISGNGGQQGAEPETAQPEETQTEEGVSDTQNRLTEEGYVQNADSGRMELLAGEILNEIRVFEGTDGTWLVCSRRPATRRIF